MGWGKGSLVADRVWSLIEYWLPPIYHQEVAKGLCDIFEDFDCDNIEDADRLYRTAYGERDE